MQPKPMAETSSLLFPSLRFCIFFSFDATCGSSGLVLLVAHVLHPIDRLAVERLLDGDMRHRRRGRRAVPMFLAGRKPDDVARPDFLHRTVPALRPAAAGRNDQCLAERMGMPGGARSWLECNAGADDTRRIGRLEQRIDANRSGEIVSRSLAARL